MELFRAFWSKSGSIAKPLAMELFRVDPLPKHSFALVPDKKRLRHQFIRYRPNPHRTRDAMRAQIGMFFL